MVYLFCALSASTAEKRAQLSKREEAKPKGFLAVVITAVSTAEMEVVEVAWAIITVYFHGKERD